MATTSCCSWTSLSSAIFMLFTKEGFTGCGLYHRVSFFYFWIEKNTFECLASSEGALAWALKGERKVAELKSKKRPLYGQRQVRKSSGILRNDT